MNPLFAIDAYKLDHRRQYPPGTDRVYSNFTPRTSRVEGIDKVVFFGLQAFLEDLDRDFSMWFPRGRERVAREYQEMIGNVLGPNDIGVDHIRALHSLGYLPLRICAIEEGTPVPLRVPMLTVENTHPDFFWLVNYFESWLSASLWMPCTSATTAWHLRKMLNTAADLTGASRDDVAFQAHDFSFRGMSSVEAASASGAGHLLSFTGTDNIPALSWIERYYTGPNGFVGGSVPATEHSVMCAGGAEREEDTFTRLLDLYPKGIVSVVSDTWDLWAVLTKILPSLKDKIMDREGKLVIRPDSGDPVEILCGTDMYGITPEERGVVQLLWDHFGGTTNDAGYRVLDPHIGAIYGDSITYDRAQQIVDGLEMRGFASTNVVLGVGSYTYQYVTRDTFGFAMKATWAEIDGRGHDLYKEPVTDDGVKKSARGRLSVVRNDGEIMLIEQATPQQEAQSLLVPVFEDGKVLRYQSFSDVRQVLAEES